MGSANNTLSSVVWPWREGGNRAGRSSPGDTRRSALIQCGVMLVVAAVLRYALHKPVAAAVVLALAGVVLGCGLFAPPAFRAIEAFGVRLGSWVGTGMTWLLLVPFFYLCFAVGHGFLALAGKDPLHRAFLPQATTYWTPRPKITDPDYYRKQF